MNKCTRVTFSTNVLISTFLCVFRDVNFRITFMEQHKIQEIPYNSIESAIE